MVTIRPERSSDYKKIFVINKKAFKGEVEARLVENLRHTKGFIPKLSLVAVKDGKVVGHILFSIIHINTGSKFVPILALAPMAVIPEFQRRGIGSRMVREGLRNCEELGYKTVVLVGLPDYYPRFGFVKASGKGLSLPFEAPDEAFMVYEILPNTLNGISGVIVYPPEFAEE